MPADKLQMEKPFRSSETNINESYNESRMSHNGAQEDTVANTDSTHAEGSLVRAIWRLELARAKHLLRAYLRTRLIKLERHVTAVLDDPAMQARLSPLELQYAKVSCPQLPAGVSLCLPWVIGYRSSALLGCFPVFEGFPLLVLQMCETGT